MLGQKISVIYNKGDARRRYRFLYEPLRRLATEEPNLEVNLFVQDQGARGLVQAVRKSLERGRDREALIYTGADLSGLVWVFCCRLAGKRIILRLGGNQVKTLGLLMLDFWEKRRPKLWLRCLANREASRLALKLTDGLIVVSRTLGRKIRESGYLGPNCAVFTVPQTIESRTNDQPVFTDRAQAGDNSFRFLTVTNLLFSDKVRPLKTIIEGFLSAAWPDSGPLSRAVRYDIIGGGQYLSNLKAFVDCYGERLRERGINVHVHGHRDDVAAWYRRADAFLYGSTHDAVPNVLLEAQMFGLPIVCNDLEEFQELLVPEENAVFYKTGDAEDAARAIGQLLARPRLRQALAAANYERVREKFNEVYVANQLRALVNFCGEYNFFRRTD